MRIGLLTHQWPGVRLGGIGAYTVHCARALAGAGHEVHVFTLALPEDGRLALAGVRGVMVHEVADVGQRVQEGILPAALGAAAHAGGEGVARLAMASLLCEAVRRVHEKMPLDVVEGPEYEALALPLVLWPLEGGPGAAIITQLHSGSAIARLSGNAGSAASSAQSLLEALEWAVMVGADGICAPSRQVVADTMAGYGVAGRALQGDGAPNMLSGAPVPLSMAHLVPLPFYDETAYTEPADKGPILYVGRLELLKGSHLLAEAAEGLLRRHGDMEIHLAGPDTATAPSGGSMAAWMRKHSAPEAGGRMVFLGELTRSQIREELQRCAFVVVPSLFDNYPYVCCEAMAAGRPVVVSAGIGAAELVGGGGITFERGNSAALAEAMARLWVDRELRRRLSRAAYERMKRELSAEVAARGRVAMYEEAVGRVRARGRSSVQERLSGLRAADAAALIEALAAQAAFAAGVPVLRTPGIRLAEVMARHATRVGVGAARVLLFGAGRHTARLLAEKHLWEAAGHRVVGLIDDHPRFVEKPVYLGLPVQSCRALAAKLPLAEAVVLSTDAMEDLFWEKTAELRAKGLAVYRLYG